MFRTADGITLVADVAGSPDAPTVVLAHGGGQTRHSWKQLFMGLVNRGYSVVNYDARGHGDSDWAADGDYTIPALSRDLCTILPTIKGQWHWSARRWVAQAPSMRLGPARNRSRRL